MRLITKEEMETKTWRGRGGSSKVFRGIIALQKGQILFIEQADWGKRKYPPSRVVRYIEKKYKRRHNVLREAADTGWAVERLE
ncbi:MAG TPA: hypothetical protein VI757_15155 [Bacteroidia bacterium]|nr:hypothetical protein [Bacteroidia bacterium]